MLIAKNISAAYYKNQILRNVSIEIDCGEFICVCGPNGAGKSTLFSILAGLNNASLKITSGDILPSIDGIPVSKMKAKDRAKQIAFMSQSENSIWDFSVFDVVLTGRFPYTINGYYSKEDEEKALESLSEMNLLDFKDRSVHSLSGGEFQKVRIARALCQNPKFIILDEPGSSLDFVYEPSLMKNLKNIGKKRNIGIILSIHDVNLGVKFADKVLLLSSSGNGIFGKTEEVVNIENLQKTYGVDFICKEVNYFQSLV